MPDLNTERVTFDFRDARGNPVTGPVTLTGENYHLKSLNFRLTLDAFPQTVEMAAFPQGLWQVHAQPEYYRAKSFFVSVPAGEERTVTEYFFLSSSRARPVFPAAGRIFGEAKWKALADLLKGSAVGGLSGEALYTHLTKKEPLKAAGLLNLHARARGVLLKDGQEVAAGFDKLIELRQERIYCAVAGDLHGEVKKAVKQKVFGPANGGLHDFPAGYRLLKKDASFKTPEKAGNLQLTFAENDDEELIVDVDMDEAKGIEHAFEVLRHRFTGAKTHPYDIHQILAYFYPTVDPGYALQPK
jgi:hypothetical protein